LKVKRDLKRVHGLVRLANTKYTKCHIERRNHQENERKGGWGGGERGTRQKGGVQIDSKI